MTTRSRRNILVYRLFFEKPQNMHLIINIIAHYAYKQQEIIQNNICNGLTYFNLNQEMQLLKLSTLLRYVYQVANIVYDVIASLKDDFNSFLVSFYRIYFEIIKFRFTKDLRELKWNVLQLSIFSIKKKDFPEICDNIF